jgi:hypothetical protein
MTWGAYAYNFVDANLRIEVSVVVRKSQPCKIDELARLVHPRDGHPKIFAMIEAYLDESGIHDGAAVCVIAGYFGGRGQWKRFETSWRSALAKFDVPLHEFHAKDFMKRTGFFYGWPLQKQSDLKYALATAIIEYKIYPVSTGVIISDFYACSEPQRRFLTGAKIENGKLISTGSPRKPYFVPFSRVLEKVASYAPVGGKAHYFFGLDRPFSEYATVYFKDVATDPQARQSGKYGTPAFPLAKETPELQAADLFVYVTYLDMIDRNARNAWQERPPEYLLALLSRARSHGDFEYYDNDAIADHLRQTYAAQGNWDGHEEKVSPERDNPA